MIPRPPSPLSSTSNILNSSSSLNGHGNGRHVHLDVDDAEHARRRKDYAVYPIIPRREITLISGSPRVGTTTLLTMICDNFRSGKPVLGYPSYVSPGGDSHGMICYTHTKGTMQRIATAMGILTSELNLTVMGIRNSERERDKNTFGQIVKKIKSRNPAIEVIFLDGYHRLFRGNRKDYDAGADGTDSVQEVLEDENLTLVAVGRSVKVNADNIEASAMERFYGSVSTTERIGTFISMERMHHTSRENPKRVITIETQGRPQVQNWEFTNTGLLVLESEAGSENRSRDVYGDFEMVIMARGEGEKVSSEELNGIGRELGIATATVARYRNRMIERGMLEGRYGEYTVMGAVGI
jgi:hypothetical protein